MKHKNTKQKKVIKIGLVPIILCTIAIVLIINMLTPNLNEKIYNIRLKSLYADQDYKAMIGEQPYETLEEALEAASSDDEIVLLSDITIESELTVNKNITINGDNGNSDRIIFIKGISNNAELTLKNLSLYSNNNTEGNNLILNNGTLSISNIEIKNNYGCGINNKSILSLVDTDINIIAKTPVIGKVNNIRVNHGLSISTYTGDSTLKLAKVINIYNIGSADLVLSQNIIYSNIYDAFKAIDENTTEEVEVILLKDMTTTIETGYIKVLENQKIKLNLNGHLLKLNSIKGTDETYAAGIINTGYLTIENGTINELSQEVSPIIANTGTLNLNNVNTARVQGQYLNTDAVTNYSNSINITGTVKCHVSVLGGKANISADIYGNITNGSHAYSGDSGEVNFISGSLGQYQSRGEMRDSSLINYSGTMTLGTEASDDETRLKINNMVRNEDKLIINNAEIKVETGNAIYSEYQGSSVLIKDGVVTSGNDHTIKMVGTFIIEKGTVTTEGSGVSAVLNRSNTIGFDTTTIIGVDDKQVNQLEPVLGPVTTGSVYTEDTATHNFGFFDGVLLWATFGNDSDPWSNSENKNYYKENYEIKSSEYNGVTGYRLVDIKDPVINNVKVVKNENTYNSIKLLIDAIDTGVGIDKCVIRYQNRSESITQTMEHIWEASEDNINYVTIPNLEIGSEYAIELTIYDKAGRNATSNVITAETTSGITGITVSPTTLTLEIDETANLTTTINPNDATNKSVEWVSSNAEVATVEDGVVTAISPGQTTITVTTVDGSKTATCTVTVTEPTIAVTGVSLNKSTLSLNVGGTETLTETITPAEATNQEVQWTSTDSTVATVENGVVTAISAGQATIKVTTEDGGYTATCTVTVTEPTIAVTGVSLNKYTLSLNVGGTETLIATVNPSGATNKNVTWSSDSTVATVDQNGKVTAVGVGKAIITVTTEDGGKTATCEVTVTEVTPTPDPTPTVSVTGVTLNKANISLVKGNTETLIATVNPSGATNKNVTWSSDSIAATVDQNGKVTAVGVGKAIITVTTEDGGKTATCEVTVTEVTPTPDPTPTPTPDPTPDLPQDENINLESISINKKEISLYKGENQTLKLTINPSNATIDKTIYTSSNIDVATVDENGKITAVGKGTTTITIVVTDKKGNVKTAECKVYVLNKDTIKDETDTDKDKENETEKENDKTLADKVLPSTGLGKVMLFAGVLILLCGTIMLIKYRKIRDIK